MTILISITVPCRNEAGYIDAFLRSALAQQLPPDTALEVLVADGASDDGTRALLEAWAARDARVRAIDNPQGITSAALNQAIAAAQGGVIVRMDVHTTYAPDYVAQCLAALQRTGAANVGGPWRAQGQGAWGRAIAAAFQSRWVAGGARSRQLDFEGEVDTVYLGCWPRETFQRFGLFDETLVRNQDDEHNLRIVRGGGRVWQSAHIHSTYVPRDSLGALWRQWLQYGYWKPFVMKKHGQAAALRHRVPGLFVAGLLGLALLALAGGPAWPLAGLAGLYALVVAGLSLAVATTGPHGGLLLRLPWVIAAQQLAYGLGSLLGGWDAWRHGQGRARFARLTR